tara:strand:+ start:15119 stop:15373 length:255 start_codon:yes stop_codon:yes gene_type:complete
MNESLLFLIHSFFLVFFLIVGPISLKASEIDSTLLKDLEPNEIVEAPRQMSEKQMNDLFGEDPYLGQTSYLQSPDSFIQRDQSK